MKKGWIITLLVTVVLALAVFFGYKWFSNHAQQPQTSSGYQASRTFAENLEIRKSNCTACRTCRNRII